MTLRFNNGLRLRAHLAFVVSGDSRVFYVVGPELVVPRLFATHGGGLKETVGPDDVFNAMVAQGIEALGQTAVPGTFQHVTVVEPEGPLEYTVLR